MAGMLAPRPVDDSPIGPALRQEMLEAFWRNMTLYLAETLAEREDDIPPAE
jgi:hypothetical protein